MRGVLGGTKVFWINLGVGEENLLQNLGGTKIFFLLYFVKIKYWFFYMSCQYSKKKSMLTEFPPYF